MDLVDILHEGGDNMGGVIGFISYIPLTDVDTSQLPTLTAVGKLDFSTPIIPKVGKKFIKIYGTLGTMKLDGNSVGERDGKSTENTVEFFHPGQKQIVSEFKRKIQNTPCIVIVRDTTGNQRVLGLVNLDEAGTTITADIPCYYDAASSTTGAKSADERGFRFIFKNESPHDALYYKGDIQYTPTPEP